MSNAFPKILIYGEVFKLNTGGGITLSNLFSDWPSENLAVLSERAHEANGRICHNYYHLGNKEIRIRFPLSLIYRVNPSSERYIVDENVSCKSTIKSSGNLIKKILRPSINIFRLSVTEFLHRIGFYHSMTTISLSPDLKDYIQNFNPDVIYCQIFSFQAISLIRQLQSYSKKPLVIHIMDDFPNIIIKKGIRYNYWKNQIHNQFKDIISISSLRLSISERMSREFKSRYGYDFIPLRNPIDVKFWEPKLKCTYKIHDRFVILYAGRLAPGTDRTLFKIAMAVERVISEFGFNIEMLIAANNKPNWIKKFKSTRYLSYISYENLPAELSSASLLVIPFDFNEIGKIHYRLSLPTKLSEYMASGTPIMVVAPRDTALFEYVYINKVSFTLDTDDQDFLVALIKDIFLKESKREDFAIRALDLVKKDSESTIVKGKFLQLLISVANRQSVNHGI